ncbi:15213_t:CDS:2 [Gigaspora margarita]|uniref:15213_t:CDS:1 n=1 Tax=Gigaspora margarita TaxID=4874 RepID=A0ABM8W205_GIGMA|nr:15213_t:CDS:2 [Gigaspora margarita]
MLNKRILYFFPVNESDRPANSTCSKKCRIEDLTLMELLKKEKVLNEVEETSKQVVTELKLLKNPHPISALKMQIDNTDYIDSGDKVGESGIFLEAVEDPS